MIELMNVFLITTGYKVLFFTKNYSLTELESEAGEFEVRRLPNSTVDLNLFIDLRNSNNVDRDWTVDYKIVQKSTAPITVDESNQFEFDCVIAALTDQEMFDYLKGRVIHSLVKCLANSQDVKERLAEAKIKCMQFFKNVEG